MSALKGRAVCRPRLEPGTLKVALLASLLASTVVAQEPHPLDVAAGQALFERQWVAAPASTAASDGLGPFYNARSCAECHPAGGASEAWEHVVLRLDDPNYGRQLQTRALAGLRPEARLTASESINESTEFVGQSLMYLRISVDQLRYGALSGPWSLRMPPSLHGIGGISAVRDSSLLALADPDDANHDGISGRLARVVVAGVEQIGRYGWKAEGPTLGHQVASAFSLDLGLGSVAFPAAHGDCTAVQVDCLRGVDGAVTGNSEFELHEQVTALTSRYLQSLRPPEQAPQDTEGLALFSSLGCQACHLPQLDGQWLFSDLLLHDMGPGLTADLPEAQADASEWRTAPLSALSGKKRFLHDGRARNLQEAILWHGGEAAQARSSWLALTPDAQDRLKAFLKQLQMR